MILNFRIQVFVGGLPDGELREMFNRILTEHENGATSGPVLDSNGAAYGQWVVNRGPGDRRRDTPH